MAQKGNLLFFITTSRVSSSPRVISECLNDVIKDTGFFCLPIPAVLNVRVIPTPVLPVPLMVPRWFPHRLPGSQSYRLPLSLIVGGHLSQTRTITPLLQSDPPNLGAQTTTPGPVLLAKLRGLDCFVSYRNY